jgi:hypothetical protein
MKGFVISMMSTAVLILAGWQSVGHSATPELQLGPEPMIINGFEGAWYSFPGGLMIRFNSDGSADFGVDTDGTPIGYQAHTWFEGDKLSIRFSNYDGAMESCRDATGVYQVQQLKGGNIRFVTIDDACQFRSDALSGHKDLGFELVFHYVSS